MIKKTKEGAASFYVVAFSTLILLIVVASFTALVVAQITRSSNDDLSQSAYDSALAGVEDAKLAFYNYQACVAQGVKASKPARLNSAGGEKLSCGAIMWLIEKASAGNADEELSAVGLKSACDVVPVVLGRTIGDNGVAVAEGTNNNMQQYYTCVKIETNLANYKATLSAANQMKVVQPKFTTAVDKIVKMRVSWGAGIDKATFGSNKLSTLSGTTNPPIITVALVQAGGNGTDTESFAMKDFDLASGTQTNRGMLYLVPQRSGGAIEVNASTMVNSNNKLPTNNPVLVNCSAASGSGYACFLDVNLPKPIGGQRSDDNFVIAVSLPYGETTDFQLEFFCDGNENCGSETVWNEDYGERMSVKSQASLSGVQIAVDATGRANDLFRRVETRFEGADSFAMSLMGPLELTGDGSSDNNAPLNKDYAITCEHNFESQTSDYCMNDTSDSE